MLLSRASSARFRHAYGCARIGVHGVTLPPKHLLLSGVCAGSDYSDINGFPSEWGFYCKFRKRCPCALWSPAAGAGRRCRKSTSVRECGGAAAAAARCL